MAEYYIKKTKDLLADEVIPSELGVSRCVSIWVILRIKVLS